MSPGYTILLAVIFDLFWESTTGEIIKELVSTTVTSFDFALLPFTADRLFKDATIGVLAGMTSALFP